jgi:hypothetical protein
VKAGGVKVVGGIYELKSGKVEFCERFSNHTGMTRASLAANRYNAVHSASQNSRDADTQIKRLA